MSIRTMPRLPISACLIAKDEERDLPAAIASVDFVDEVVVVVDATSTDRTAEVAVEAAAPDQRVHVTRRDWQGHVAQKNAALDEATNDWVLCLDADERVSPALRDEIVALFASGAPELAGYTSPRRTFYLGRWIDHGGWYPDCKLRLFRRSHGRWGGVDPHDHAYIDGTEGTLRGDLLHYSYENISDHIAKMDSYTHVAAARMYDRGRRAAFLRMVFAPPVTFLRMYVLRRGFRDGFEGLIVAGLGTFYTFLKYAKLWERRVWAQRARSHGAVREL